MGKENLVRYPELVRPVYRLHPALGVLTLDPTEPLVEPRIHELPRWWRDLGEDEQDRILHDFIVGLLVSLAEQDTSSYSTVLVSERESWTAVSELCQQVPGSGYFTCAGGAHVFEKVYPRPVNNWTASVTEGPAFTIVDTWESIFGYPSFPNLKQTLVELTPPLQE